MGLGKRKKTSEKTIRTDIGSNKTNDGVARLKGLTTFNAVDNKRGDDVTAGPR